MKLLFAFSLSLLVLAAAETEARKNPVLTVSAQVASAPLGIPAGAVKSDDGSYRYTDRQGKKWLYRKTPFGVARLEDKPAAPAAADEAAKRFENVKATEDGDTIRFERPGPFGIYKWQRNKTQLNEMEQTVWDRQRARTAAGQD